MMGPEPMIRTDLMELSLGIGLFFNSKVLSQKLPAFCKPVNDFSYALKARNPDLSVGVQR